MMWMQSAPDPDRWAPVLKDGVVLMEWVHLATGALVAVVEDRRLNVGLMRAYSKVGDQFVEFGVPELSAMPEGRGFQDRTATQGQRDAAAATIAWLLEPERESSGPTVQ